MLSVRESYRQEDNEVRLCAAGHCPYRLVCQDLSVEHTKHVAR